MPLLVNESAGWLRGVSAGLVYYADGEGTLLPRLVQGRAMIRPSPVARLCEKRPIVIARIAPAGRETVTPTETDAWLHGAAPLASVPTADADAELSLTLYDSASASLISFSGTVGADGSVTLAADASGATDTSGCTSRLGCTVTEAPDIELLAAEVFASAGGYELSVDLTGSAARRPPSSAGTRSARCGRRSSPSSTTAPSTSSPPARRSPSRRTATSAASSSPSTAATSRSRTSPRRSARRAPVSPSWQTTPAWASR